MSDKQNQSLNKKILIISSWAPPKVGGAQNLYNIFKYINCDNYFILTRRQNMLGTNGTFGSKLDCEYYFYSKETNNIIIDPGLPKKKYYYILKQYKTVFNFLKNLVSLIKFFTVNIVNIYRIIKISKSIIKNKKIDLLMGISDSEVNLLSTFIASLFVRKPFCLYLFDLYLGNQLNFPYNIIARIFEPVIFKKAKHIIVTNGATKSCYVNKYGNEKKYSIIHNSVSASLFKDHKNIIKDKKDNIINIVFTGHIYWAQERSLKNLLNAIQNRKEQDISLTVYSPILLHNLVGRYKECKNIKFSSASQSEMPRIQGDADILFLPLSWNPEAPDIIKTASPGKLTDYLIAGKPILIHAPDYSFVTQYAKENKFAEVVDKESEEGLITAIKKISNNKKYSDNLVENAKKTFYKNHDAFQNSQKLVNIINNI